jgi:hypothetical protein
VGLGLVGHRDVGGFVSTDEVHGEMEHVRSLRLVHNEPQRLPPVELDDCEHELRKVCSKCGHEFGEVED